MHITFLGIRGTAPAFQPDQQRYGGHTACIVIQTKAADIILDAGSGLGSFAPRPHRPMVLLLSHLHLDHLIGLPASPLLYSADNRIHIYGPPGTQHALRTLLNPPFSPLPLDALPARLHITDIEAGATLHPSDLDVRIDTHPLNHPGGCLAYRIGHHARNLVYATDHEHIADQDQSLIRFCHQTDLLILDAHFDASEAPRHQGWGHSDWQTAACLARLSQARRAALIHHHPARRDDQLDAWNRLLQTRQPGIFFAREGQTLNLDPQDGPAHASPPLP